MKTYIKNQTNIFQFIKEYIFLFFALRTRSKTSELEANKIVSEYDFLAEQIGIDISMKDILEVGCGQIPLRLAYFHKKARTAVGIDLDVIAVDYSMSEFAKMYRHNGAIRTVRTFGRQWLGLNKNLIRSFCAHIGYSRFPKLEIVQGDVCGTTHFKDASFDVVISTNVFEHLPDPEKAVIEIARLLRPGGVVLVSTCHWGQANAMHDLEVMYDIKPARWAHLRSHLNREVQQHAYVNEFRVGDWQVLFSKYFGDVTVNCVAFENSAKLEQELKIVRAGGELPDYSDEELLCEACIVRGTGRLHA